MKKKPTSFSIVSVERSITRIRKLYLPLVVPHMCRARRKDDVDDGIYISIRVSYIQHRGKIRNVCQATKQLVRLLQKKVNRLAMEHMPYENTNPTK